MTIEYIYRETLAGRIPAPAARAYYDERDVIISYWMWRIRREELHGIYHYSREDATQMKADLAHDEHLLDLVYNYCYKQLDRLNGETNIDVDY